MSAWPAGTRRAALAARPGTVKRIHINRGIVAQNRRLGGTLPEITIQTSAGSIPCRKVEIVGPSRMVQGLKPLKCGARIWIETRGVVRWSATADKTKVTCKHCLRSLPR